MNANEAYQILQKQSDIRVGDKVKVTRKALSYEMGWNHDWDFSMDNSVGKILTVKEISKDYIKLDNTNKYPFFVLEILKEKVPQTENYTAYQTLQKISGIEVGYKVKVLKIAESYKMGWFNMWSSTQNETVGQILTVEKISEDYGITLNNGFKYPFFVLEKIKTEHRMHICINDEKFINVHNIPEHKYDVIMKILNGKECDVNIFMDGNDFINVPKEKYKKIMKMLKKE